MMLFLLSLVVLVAACMVLAKTKWGRAAVAAIMASVAFPTWATDPPATLVDLTGAISFATMTAAVLAVALLVINYKVLKQGALTVMRSIGWAR